MYDEMLDDILPLELCLGFDEFLFMLSVSILLGCFGGEIGGKIRGGTVLKRPNRCSESKKIIIKIF